MAKTIRVGSYTRKGKRVRGYTRRIGGTRRHGIAAAPFVPLIEEYTHLTRADLPSASAQMSTALAPDPSSHIESSFNRGGYRRRIVRGKDGSSVGLTHEPDVNRVRVRLLKKGTSYGKTVKSSPPRRRRAGAKAVTAPSRSKRLATKAKKQTLAARKAAKGLVVGPGLTNLTRTPAMNKPFQHGRVGRPPGARRRKAQRALATYNNPGLGRTPHKGYPKLKRAVANYRKNPKYKRRVAVSAR